MTSPTTPRAPVASGHGAGHGAPLPQDRHRVGYGLALLVAVVGAAAAGLWAVTGFLDQIQRPEQFARADIPGSAVVAITQTGTHVLYVEGAEPGHVSATDLTVVGPQGAPLPVEPYALDLRYDVPGAPGRTGAAVATFDADRTGTYLVGIEADLDRATLAVGDDLAPDVLRSLLVPSAVGALAVLAGIGLALVTWGQDERRTRR